MFKPIFAIVIILLILSLPSNVFASHKSPQGREVPEINGLYDDPDHRGVKVRVFVHPQGQNRPSHTTSSQQLICNLQDPQSLAEVASTLWHLPGSWTYHLNPSSVPSSVGGTNLPTITSNSFNAWSSATSSKVNFTRGANTIMNRQSYDGRNIVAFNRISGTALGITYVRYYTSNGLVVDVDTIMNKKYPWSWSNSSMCADPASYDAQNILTHEIGHWMGLDDMYDEANYKYASMYGYGSKGEVLKNTLTEGDIDGVNAIYP